MTIETRRKGSEWVQNMIRHLTENPLEITSEQDKARVIELSQQGHQLSLICHETGLSQSKVRYILRCEREKAKAPVSAVTNTRTFE